MISHWVTAANSAIVPVPIMYPFRIPAERWPMSARSSRRRPDRPRTARSHQPPPSLRRWKVSSMASRIATAKPDGVGEDREHPGSSPLPRVGHEVDERVTHPRLARASRSDSRWSRRPVRRSRGRRPPRRR